MVGQNELNKSVVSKRSVEILAVIVLTILSLAIVSNSMTKPIGRDEQMYCTGAVLMAQGKMIYRDFSYAAQLPYHPLLYAAVYKITGTTHYLLAGRLISTICDILVMICIVGIYRCVFKSSIVTGTLLGLAAAVLYIFNPLVDYASGFAWNHDVVILCIMLSLWLFISTDFQQKSAFWRTAAIGALLMFATCMRVTTVLAAFLFFVILLCMTAGSVVRRLKNALPFMAASTLVLIWPVWVIAHAPRAFYLNLIKIPTLYGQWLHEIGMIYDKVDLTIACLTTPGYFVLIALSIYLWLAVFILGRRLKIKDKSKLLLTALLPLVFFIIALIPPTMWRQYFAVPVPFLLAGLAFPFSFISDKSLQNKIRRYYKTAVVFIIICVVVAVVTYPVVLYKTPLVMIPEIWTPIELHRISENIANEMPEPKTALTLAPLYAIEGGCDIYTELSCGAIIYRIADSLTDQERQITHTVGPETLPELVSERPPAAVITGIEMESLERSLFNSVVELNWPLKEYENGPTVYFRP